MASSKLGFVLHGLFTRNTETACAIIFSNHARRVNLREQPDPQMHARTGYALFIDNIRSARLPSPTPHPLLHPLTPNPPSRVAAAAKIKKPDEGETCQQTFVVPPPPAPKGGEAVALELRGPDGSVVILGRSRPFSIVVRSNLLRRGSFFSRHTRVSGSIRPYF